MRSTRTAGRSPPPTITWPTPSICESFSAESAAICCCSKSGGNGIGQRRIVVWSIFGPDPRFVYGLVLGGIENVQLIEGGFEDWRGFDLPECDYIAMHGVYAWISEAAYVVGDVEVGPNSSIWPGAVVRGDLAPVRT